MSLYNGPPRPGARGGRDQFNWENVKSDKDREYYLGHSVKALTGRWQKGKDVYWYTREKEGDEDKAVQNELAMVKQREEELMMEALGLKPKTVRQKTNPQLDARDMKMLMEGNPDEQAEEDGNEREGERIKGIGYAPGQIMGAAEGERETMAGVGMSRQPDPDSRAQFQQQIPPPPVMSESKLKKLRKEQKKEQKRLDKAAKKEAKKAAKKKHKEKEHRSADGDRKKSSKIEHSRKLNASHQVARDSFEQASDSESDSPPRRKRSRDRGDLSSDESPVRRRRASPPRQRRSFSPRGRRRRSLTPPRRR